MKVSEFTKEIDFMDEIERVLKEINKAFKLKANGLLTSNEQLESLFFDKDEKIDIDDCLLKEREIFFDWTREEYNPQIQVFLDSSINEKKISTLFFIEALNKFKNQVKQFIE